MSIINIYVMQRDFDLICQNTYTTHTHTHQCMKYIYLLCDIFPYRCHINYSHVIKPYDIYIQSCIHRYTIFIPFSLQLSNIPYIIFFILKYFHFILYIYILFFLNMHVYYILIIKVLDCLS